MNENIKWGGAAVAVVGLTIGAFLYLSRGKEAPAPVAPPVTAPKPVAEIDDPTPKNPLPVSDAKEPLPKLADSDQPLLKSLTTLVGADSVERFFVPDDLVRHIVVSVDNLSEQKVAERIRPMRRLSGPFAVTGTEDAPMLDPANYERYKPWVQFIQSTDTQQLVVLYSRYYPLFQEAYESLGHPPRHFNDRAIFMIDHLLATPDVQGPIALAQPNVQFEFADPKLESLSAGQKVMIRMGSENAAAMKAKLRELRAALAARPN
jgi:hypothetical protein